jgi:hypothetical protein
MMMSGTGETLEQRLDRLEALLVGVADRLDRFSDALIVPLCLQERSLRRLERTLGLIHEASPLQQRSVTSREAGVSPDATGR